MGACFGAPSTELTPALLGLDQPHLTLSSGKGGSAFLIDYYYAGDLHSHPGTVSLIVHNDGRLVTGAGRDDIDNFTIHGRLVVLAASNVWLYFNKRYTSYGSHTIQYRGQCVDVAASVFVGEWSIGGGWLGTGSWSMRPMGGRQSTALIVTDVSTQASAAQRAATHPFGATA